MNYYFESLEQYGEKISQGPIVIDNFLSEEVLEQLEIAMKSTSKWGIPSYLGTSNFSNEDMEKEGGSDKIYEQFQFVKPIMHQSMEGCDQVLRLQDIDNYHLFTIPLTLGLMKLNLWYTAKGLIKAKANLQTRAPKHIKGKFNFPHTDLDVNAIEKGRWGHYITTGIFYVNDSDGDTYLFKNPDYRSKYNKCDDWRLYVDNLEVETKVSPKRGRLVLFPSYTLHAGSHPIENDSRVVINYNFIPKGILTFPSNDYFNKDLKK